MKSSIPTQTKPKSHARLSRDEGSLKLYFREIRDIPLLSPEEEIELARRVKQGDEEARYQLIRANLRLVAKIAGDYANYGLPLMDLISEGNLGLIKAVERFDPSKGGKLSTYGAWWIKQTIKRALANQTKTIRLPVHLVDKLATLRRVSALLADSLGREPSDDEICEETGISPKKLAFLRRVAMKPASLDAPVVDDGDSSLAELIGDEQAEDPSEALSSKNMREELERLMQELDERELGIIEARFGLNGKTPMTLDEVGQNFQVTRERIRQLQNIALEKMRRRLDRREKPIRAILSPETS